MRIEIPRAQAYIESLASGEALSKRKSRTFAEELGLGNICLSPAEGHLLAFLVRMHECLKFVEIGTLTGLSAQYIIEGMGGKGELWTLEKTDLHAKKAMEAIAEHPSGKNIHVIVGDARFTLESLQVSGPFDGVFIDGNKAAYGDYLMWAEKNVRPGGLIVADNVFLSGAVWGSIEGQSKNFSEKQVAVMQNFNKRLSDPTLYDSVILPTKEGMFFAVKMF
ncbi:MAG: class I SAM-dependent methyltransferase [Bdellovibrionaceae bacterium]|nr:class I SAM-dependent methyltransferase [Pseudobdellovibrionaceae bacterium]